MAANAVAQRKREKKCAQCEELFTLKPRSTAACCSAECKRIRDARLARDLEQRILADPERRAKRMRQKCEANGRYSKRHRHKVRQYYTTRRQSDPDFHMACWMRSTLAKVLSRANRRKDAKCTEILGYDGSQLRAHIENQFARGMGWHNRSEWEIDHVIPIAEWLRRGVTDPAVINALPNLRPMWSEDNRAKSDKVLTLV